MDDLAAVAAGSKPAAIYNRSDMDHPEFVEIFNTIARTPGMAARGMEHDMFAGRKENVEELLRIWEQGGERDHRRIGELLGYPPEVIENFLQRMWNKMLFPRTGISRKSFYQLPCKKNAYKFLTRRKAVDPIDPEIPESPMEEIPDVLPEAVQSSPPDDMPPLEPVATVEYDDENAIPPRTDEQQWAETLKQDPSPTTLQVYADWLEERGNPNAELIRGLLKPRKSKDLWAKIDELWGDVREGGDDIKWIRFSLMRIVPIAYYAFDWNIPPSRAYSLVRMLNTRELVGEASPREGLRGRVAEDILQRANSMIGGYGTEAIQGDHWDNYYGEAVAEYVNMGDTYDLTVLYDVPRDRFLITSYGDWVERNQERYGIQ